jgi:hypothetical protein
VSWKHRLAALLDRRSGSKYLDDSVQIETEGSLYEDHNALFVRIETTEGFFGTWHRTSFRGRLILTADRVRAYDDRDRLMLDFPIGEIAAQRISVRRVGSRNFEFLIPKGGGDGGYQANWKRKVTVETYQPNAFEKILRESTDGSQIDLS